MVSFSSLLSLTFLSFIAVVHGSTYWLEDAPRNGIAAFNPNPASYQVFRNVKDFGAVGDGSTDDTAAINAAIAAGNRCGAGCNSSSTTPALVYFPEGTYAVSAPIIDLYYTTLVGNPWCLPIIKVLPSFNLTTGTVAVIEGDPASSAGAYYGATNIFWRSVRNFVIDTTAFNATQAINGVHWRTGQATSLQNIEFRLSKDSGTQHVGVFIEDGSGGSLFDLTFYGGLAGLSVGNQQFTMRNLVFHDAVTAINQIWNWGWTYSGVTVDNCSVALNASNIGPNGLLVGSVNLIDSTIKNTPIGIITARTAVSTPKGAGVINIENVEFDNVHTILQGVNGTTLLKGGSGSKTVEAYSQGNAYTPNGPRSVQGPIKPNRRPASLLAAGSSRYYARSKPTYVELPWTSFISARSAGAKGDGKTDDTAALNAAIAKAASSKKVLYLDHGDYLVTKTIHIPAGTRIVGEVFPVILSSGPFFNDLKNPKPVVQVGKPGEHGAVELSDFIISGRGPQAGAILLQINLASDAHSPSGYWDVHTRVGGFAGSDLQLRDCAITPGNSTVRRSCMAAFMSLHLTESSSGHYLENTWFWVADHDVEDPLVRQISIYAGRGLLDESAGPVWLVGTAVEHHSLYQYQFSGAADVFAGYIQTETAYYQPNPPATQPFPPDARYKDPTTFDGRRVAGSSRNGTLSSHNSTSTSNSTTAVGGWGLRIVDSEDVLVYGAGHYSFFNDNNVTCSNAENGLRCQRAIVDIRGSRNRGVSIYGLATVGAEYMFTLDGVDSGYYLDNPDYFSQTIGLLRV